MATRRETLKFLKELEDETGVARKRWSKWHQSILRRVAQRVPLRTPVDTGRTKSNWTMSRIQSLGITGRISEPRRKDSTLGMETFILTVQDFDTVYLINRTPYVSFLEEGWGSQQAPNGMVEVTFAELRGKRTIDRRLSFEVL